MGKGEKKEPFKGCLNCDREVPFNGEYACGLCVSAGEMRLTNEGYWWCKYYRHGDDDVKSTMLLRYYDGDFGIWYPAAFEPNPNLDAWIIMQTGDDQYECVKYGGYNEDGGLTWEKNSRNRGLLRWMYLPVNALGCEAGAEPDEFI